MRAWLVGIVILFLTVLLVSSASPRVSVEPHTLPADPHVVVAHEEEESVCGDALLSDLAKKMEGENLDENLRVLQPYATQCSGNAEYHAIRGHALENGGDWPNAAKEMNTAIKLDPRRPNFFFRLAQI